MFGISGVELAVIVVVALIVFGPRQLPEMLRTMGHAFRHVGRMRDEVRRQVGEFMREVDLQVDLERRHAVKPPARGSKTAPDVRNPTQDGMTGEAGTPLPKPLPDDIERT